MNNTQKGLNFEFKAINILKSKGFKLIEHTSQIRNIAPYDAVFKKNNKLFFVEIKGHSGKANSFFLKNTQLKPYVYIENVWLFLINDFEYRFFRLEDSEDLSVLKGFHLNLGIDVNTLISEKIEFLSRLKLAEKSTHSTKDISFVIEPLGDKGILILSKDKLKAYNLKIGDIAHMSLRSENEKER